MLRDKNLIPLSHQHQRALALCVRIERASPVPPENLEAWQSEIAMQFRNEIAIHFAAEEQVLFAEARRFEELRPLVEDLVQEHAELRQRFARAESREMSGRDLLEFAQRLAAHVRKEERQLFERMQALMSAEELAALGTRLNLALADTEQVCAVPTEATRLRGKV